MGAALSDFQGNAIYLDTMLPYALLRAVTPDVVAFFGRIEKQELTAFTSVLTFDELAYRFILALIKDKYGGSPLEMYRKEQHKLIAEFAPRVIAELRRLRNFTNLVVVDVSAAELERMNETILTYQMQPRDSLHYAAMQRVGCMHLASNDAHFDRIPSVKRYTF